MEETIDMKWAISFLVVDPVVLKSDELPIAEIPNTSRYLAGV